MTLNDLEIKYAELDVAAVNDFLNDVQVAARDPEIGSLRLVGFLEKIVGDVRPAERDALILHGKVIAAMMILLEQTRSAEALRDRTLQFLEYASASVKARYDYVGTAVKVLNYKITETGLNWSVLKDSPSLDIIVLNLIKGIRFDEKSPERFALAGKGKIVIDGGIMRIYSSEVGESGAKAFDIANDSIEVITRNARDEKLKNSEQGDAEAIAAFAESFIGFQDAFVAGRGAANEYQDGDEVDICITGVAGNTLLCETVGSDDRLTGKILNEELIRGVRVEDLADYFFDKDCIRGATLSLDGEDVSFSIRDAYIDYARSRAVKDYRHGAVFEARVLKIHENWEGRIVWITPVGYVGMSLPIAGETLREGDIRIMQVARINDVREGTYINLAPPENDYEEVAHRFDPEDPDSVLLDFIANEDEVLSEEKGEEKNRDEARDTARVKTLTSILTCRTVREGSLEAYRYLLVSMFLLKVIGEKVAFDAVRVDAYYRRRILSFAQGNKVPSVHPITLPEDKGTTLRILSLWGTSVEDLIPIMVGLKKGSVQSDVAKLIMSLQVSSKFENEIKADRGLVRKKICSLLGAGDQYRADGGTHKGKYGLVEGQEVEFKSSYVFRNDSDGVPDIDYQGRGQVFEAVCGFLNADGGTVYIGVNDSGDPILGSQSGLWGDIVWLGANYNSINASRRRALGHPVNKVASPDQFVQFLNSEKEMYFKESLRRNITIEVTEDLDAIRIRVAPAEYELAYLYSSPTLDDGVAYVRDGGRTVPMSRVQKEQRLSSLKKITKEMGFVVTIQEAIDQHRKLIFKDYASGNSGKINDRFVVPVNLFYNHENVYCYDLVARKYKQFRLKRISSIESDLDDPVYTLERMVPKKVDVFRWLEEDESYHIKLKMAVGAKNYLLEEYSCAEQLPPEQLYDDGEGNWILDTTVYGLGAVRRFYLGLADKIEILDTEDSDKLKAEIAAFRAEFE